MVDSCDCANASIALSSLARNFTLDNIAVTWVEGPATRGTFDILYLCIFSIVLATWYSLRLNVPARNERIRKMYWRQFYWTLLAMICPDYVMINSLGQRLAVSQSTKAFAKFGCLSRKHAFLADMGGLELQTKDSEEAFRINSRHVKYLLSKNYIKASDMISDEDIDDKSKEDWLGKVVTILQAGYLIVQCMVRFFLGMGISILEQYAFEIIYCSIYNWICWWYKPSGIQVPFVIKTERSLQEIRQEAKESVEYEGLKHPLEFVDDLRPSWRSHLARVTGSKSNYQLDAFDRFSKLTFVNL